jgi:5-methylcytosine-specific restriction protein A
VKVRNPFYLTPKWKATRLQVLRRDRYYCQECGALCLGKKRGMPSPQVDHIEDLKDAPNKAYDMSNLRTLCMSCHSKKTILTTMGKAKPEIGADGYPIISA